MAAARGLQGAQQAARTAAVLEAKNTAVAPVVRNNRVLDLLDDLARDRAGDVVAQTPLASASFWQAAAVGDAPAARLFNDVVGMARLFPNAPGMPHALASATTYHAVAQVSFLGGLAADAPGKAADTLAASRWVLARSSWGGAP